MSAYKTIAATTLVALTLTASPAFANWEYQEVLGSKKVVNTDTGQGFFVKSEKAGKRMAKILNKRTGFKAEADGPCGPIGGDLQDGPVREC